MVLLHPALLVGLLLVSVPVILHLLMRAKPKKLLFPALRLIQNRRRTNVRRMRLRHLWLLLLRMAAIGLLVFAIARPTLPAADYSLTGMDWLRLTCVVAVAVGAYFGIMALWRKRRVPQHVLAYRRTFLRAGLGLAGLLAFLFLVAWPYQRRIAAAITQPTVAANEYLPVAAVMLFDTSLSMTYRHESRTRLEMVQDIATRYVGMLPRLSRVAVCDTSGDSAIRFQSDLSGAVKRIAALTTTPVSRSLDDRLLAAIEAQIDDYERTNSSEGAALHAAGQEGLLREVYVFTDLAASSWRHDESPRLKEALAKLPTVAVYLIDVGVTSPTNVAVTGLTLSDQTIPVGSEVTLRAAVEAIGVEAGERTIEVHVENEAGKLVKQGGQEVKVDPAAAVAVPLTLRAQAGAVLQGEVRLVSSDPLVFDDVQYFSVYVQPPLDVLVVAESRGESQLLTEALAPSEQVQLGKARYRCRYTTPAKLASEKLSKYAVVCLLNVADPQPAGWNALADYLDQGGGVAIILGDRVQHVPYISPAAANVLPANLLSPLSFNPPEFLDLQNLTHPIFRRFADWGTSELTAAEIRRYWRVKPLPHDTAVVATYTDRRRDPVMVEKAHGKGRVLLVTTPFDRSGWNDLFLASWSPLALADQMMRYLSQSSQNKFNYTAGEEIQISLDPARPIPAYFLRKPGLQQLRNDIPAGTTTLMIREADQLGNYRVVTTDKSMPFERGFSVNFDPAESRFQRLTKDELDARLGAERYAVARDIEALQRSVKTGRLGREAFPLVVFLLLVVFIGEHFVANRFYDEQAPPAAS